MRLLLSCAGVVAFAVMATAQTVAPEGASFSARVIAHNANDHLYELRDASLTYGPVTVNVDTAQVRDTGATFEIDVRGNAHVTIVKPVK